MPTYHYTAVNKQGEVYEGTADVEDKFELYDRIRKEGGAPRSIEEATTGVRGLVSFSALKRLNEIVATVKTQEKVVFSRTLAAMIEAGLSVSRAFSVLERQTKNPKFSRTLSEINNRVQKGVNLHVAMGEYENVFPPLMVAMVKAGEESGKLSEVLRVVADQLEKADTLKKKVRGAMIYPAIIVVAMIVIGILMLIYVVPTLTSTFEELGVELPLSTQFIIATSKFLTNNTILGLAIAIAVGVGIWRGLKTERGKRAFEWTILHIPIIGTMVKETNAARTSRTLSSLLSSGVEVVQALSITSEVVQNSYYRDVIDESKGQIQKGDPIAVAFQAHENLYPALVGEMMAVGEETGQLTDMLDQVAEFYESEVARKTKDLSTVIEPFLMVFIGTVVGFFAISMITPIYSLSSGI